jgi:hypothetical protein
MDVQSMASTVTGGLTRFARFERVLAAGLLVTPVLLWVADDFPGSLRGSISAYHDVDPPQFFFYPLTVLAMLFIVNGVLKREHWYNTVLGLLLSGVILFDHDGDSRWLHGAFAFAFFGGNILVILYASKQMAWRWRLAFAGGIALALVLWPLVEWITTFWVEVLSMVIIATHYILDSISDHIVEYRALHRGEKSDVRELVEQGPPRPDRGRASSPGHAN